MLKNYWQKEGTKQTVFTGVILLLAAGLIALLILLNYYFTEKLSQLQNVAVQNNQRLTQIENFLTTIESQIKAQSQTKMNESLSGEKSK